jgi:hypothetical protein
MKALGMASSIGGAVEPSSEFDNVAFDPETLAILEGVFEEAWVSIQAQRNGNITRAALAERILTLAVKGERPARLLDGALSRSKMVGNYDVGSARMMDVQHQHHGRRLRTVVD